MELRKESNRPILTADKGIAIVIMDRTEYIDKANNVLVQPVYRTIDGDQLNKLKSQAYYHSQDDKKGIRFRRQHLQIHVSHGITYPKFYGLPNIHITNIPLRPIVSSRGSATYGVAKVLAKILKPLVGKSPHHIQSIKDFIDRVSKVTPQPGKIFVPMMLLHCLLLCQ